ncbi:hypothetical protein R3P38DRAFT_2881662 [Favolaschia claudopus]|uniref:WSC domain-containing protein n=2 Tax=Favolaschia claudopus TaxID=2862362 RepID=A0AAW0D1S2_9AGAR
MLFSRRVCAGFFLATLLFCLYGGHPGIGEALHNVACFKSAVPITASSSLAAPCLNVSAATVVSPAFDSFVRVLGEFAAPVFIHQDCNCQLSAGMLRYSAGECNYICPVAR